MGRPDDDADQGLSAADLEDFFAPFRAAAQEAEHIEAPARRGRWGRRGRVGGEGGLSLRTTVTSSPEEPGDATEPVAVPGPVGGRQSASPDPVGDLKARGPLEELDLVETRGVREGPGPAHASELAGFPGPMTQVPAEPTAFAEPSIGAGTLSPTGLTGTVDQDAEPPEPTDVREPDSADRPDVVADPTSVDAAPSDVMDDEADPHPARSAGDPPVVVGPPDEVEPLVDAEAPPSEQSPHPPTTVGSLDPCEEVLGEDAPTGLDGSVPDGPLPAGGDELGGQREDNGPGGDGDADPEPRTGLVPTPSFAALTVDGVSVLTYWLVILVLVGQSALLLLTRPSGGPEAVAVVAGLVSLIWATFTVAMGVLRGKRPDGRDRPPPPWLSVVASLGCLISLSNVRMASDLAGPWPAEVVAAALLTISVAVWRGPAVGALVGVLLSGAVLVVSLAGRPDDILLRTPVATAVPAVALLVVTVAVSLALHVLRRSLGQFQDYLDERSAVIVREQAVHSANEVAAEVERSLHDTALNTLETIAAHGDHLDAAPVARRCRADAAALASWSSDAGLDDIVAVAAELDGHAARLGLTVDLIADEEDMPAGEPIALPTPVLRALRGAGIEALTNAAKHAGVRSVTIVLRHASDVVRVVIEDDGVGLRPSPGSTDNAGFGVVHSVVRRMEQIGGDVRIGPGRSGHGTRVVLEWRPGKSEPPTLGVNFLRRMAAVTVLIAWIVALTGSTLVVLGWQAYDMPVVALTRVLLPAVTAAWLLEQSRSTGRLSRVHIVAALAAYVLAGGLGPISDRYCSSLLGEGVVLDPGALLVVAVLLLAPRSGVAVSLAATVVATHAAGVLVWNAQWSACGEQTVIAGVFVLALLLATWVCVRWIRRASATLERARRDAMAAQVRIASGLRVRTEEEAWVADTLVSAQGVLTDIAEGRLSPDDPSTRSLCAEEAAFLRGLLAVGRAPEGFRRPARIWLRLLRDSWCVLTVRGSFEACDPPVQVVRAIGGFLDTVCSYAPRSEVTIFGWSDELVHGLAVTAEGPLVDLAGEEIAARLRRVAPDAWFEAEGDCVTAEWEWPAPQPQLQPLAVPALS